MEAIFKRRSVRDFINKEISREDLLKIIDAARLAPTARNEQPWEFVVITEQAVKEEIARIAAANGAFIGQAASCIAVLCRDTKYYLEDGCAAIENILLASVELGIGSCWVAGDKKPYCGEVLKFLKAPLGYKLVGLVALGYFKEKGAKIEKRSLSQVLHWQKF